jgi:hypothetical protein
MADMITHLPPAGNKVFSSLRFQQNSRQKNSVGLALACAFGAHAVGV